MNKKLLGLVLLVGLTTLPLTACGGGETPAPSPSPTTSPAPGK